MGRDIGNCSELESADRTETDGHATIIAYVKPTNIRKWSQCVGGVRHFYAQKELRYSDNRLTLILFGDLGKKNCGTLRAVGFPIM